MSKITELQNEVEKVLKQKYGSDAAVATPTIYESGSNVFYSTLVKPAGDDSVIITVMVMRTQRGYCFQVFELTHQVFLPV